MPLVLYFGGNAEEVSGMLNAIGDSRSGATPGVGWMLLDYRDYGASDGAPSETAFVADARILYDHARATSEAHRPIFAFGRRLGSGVALAASRPLDGVVLVTPFDSAVAVAKRYYPYLPLRWMMKRRFESDPFAPQLRIPLLCVIAERDDVIPPVHGERLYDAWEGHKQELLLPGAGHNDGDGPDVWTMVRHFLRQWGRTPLNDSESTRPK